MKTKSDEEKEFNKLANAYGRKAYTKHDFDNNQDLQKALKSFLSQENFVLKDDYSNLDKFQNYHYTFLENKDHYPESNDINKELESMTIEYIQKLFKITDTSTAKKIYSDEYYELFTQGYNVYVNEKGEEFQSIEIEEKIDKFHNFCINVDNSREFISEHFSGWGHFGRKEKVKAKKEIKDLIANLEILRMDTKALKVTYHFVTNYTRVNEDTRCKADILLHLQLPKIDTLEIAKKIVKNLDLSQM